MSRFRVEQEKVLAEAGQGAIRLQLVAQEKALSLFSNRERSAILKASIARAGLFWLSTYLPKRFTDYAKQLGYKITVKYEKRKLKEGGEVRPLVYSGNMANAALSGATAKGMANGDKVAVLLRIPQGDHQLAMVVQRVMRTIPESEIKDLAREFGKVLAAIINNADLSDPDKSRLTVPQRKPSQVRIRHLHAPQRRTSTRGNAAYDRRVQASEAAEG